MKPPDGHASQGGLDLHAASITRLPQAMALKVISSPRFAPAMNCAQIAPMANALDLGRRSR